MLNNQFSPRKANNSFLEIIAQEPEPMPLSTSNPSICSDSDDDEVGSLNFVENDQNNQRPQATVDEIFTTA